MAPDVRFHCASLHGTNSVHGIPRDGTIEHAHLHLEPEESGHNVEFSRAVGIPGTIFTLGPAVLLIDHAWYTAER
jgi:hypothetical protein